MPEQSKINSRSVSSATPESNWPFCRFGLLFIINQMKNDAIKKNTSEKINKKRSSLEEAWRKGKKKRDQFECFDVQFTKRTTLAKIFTHLWARNSFKITSIFMSIVWVRIDMYATHFQAKTFCGFHVFCVLSLVFPLPSIFRYGQREWLLPCDMYLRDAQQKWIWFVVCPSALCLRVCVCLHVCMNMSAVTIAMWHDVSYCEQQECGMP